MQAALRKGDQGVDLIASACAAQTPRAEMFAVVRGHPVAVFAEARVGPLNHFATRVPCVGRPFDADLVAVGKLSQRSLLHGGATQRTGPSCVMQDLAIADIDALAHSLC